MCCTESRCISAVYFPRGCHGGAFDCFSSPDSGIFKCLFGFDSLSVEFQVAECADRVEFAQVVADNPRMPSHAVFPEQPVETFIEIARCQNLNCAFFDPVPRDMGELLGFIEVFLRQRKIEIETIEIRLFEHLPDCIGKIVGP